MLQMSALSIHDLDGNPYRLDDRLLEDAGLTRVAGEIVRLPEDGKRRTVVAKTSWLDRLVDSLGPASLHQPAF